MFSFVAAALLLSAGGTFLLLPGVRRLMTRLGAVDAPDPRRKLHGRVVPLGGGVAVLGGLLLTAGLLPLLYPGVVGELAGEGARLGGFLVAALVLAGIGFWDDAVELRGRQKLAGQVLAALILVAGGTLISRVEVLGLSVEFGVFAAPLTVLFLLGAINAVNLLDGADGLAGTVGVVLGTAFCGMALINPNPARLADAALAAALVGGLLAFLRHNYPPASIFLGDAGSMLVGLTLGFVALQGSFRSAATFAAVGPLAVFAVPALDVAAAIVRRKLTGRSIYSSDRGHLHHALLDRGLSGRALPLTVGGLCAVTSGGAVLSVLTGREWVALVAVAATFAAMLGLRLFGRAECRLVASRGAGFARSIVPSRREPGAAASLERRVRVRGTRGWDDLWDQMTDFADANGLWSVDLDVNHPALREDWAAHWKRRAGHDPLRLWRMDLPLVTAEGVPVGWIRVAAEAGGNRASCLTVRDLLDALHAFEVELLDLMRPAPRGVEPGVPRPTAAARRAVEGRAVVVAG